MFLECRTTGNTQSFIKSTVLLVILYSALGGVTQGQTPRGACTLDIPVYGPTGIRLGFRVARVSPVGKGDVDLLAMAGTGIQVRASGTRVTFPVAALSRRFQIRLKGEKGEDLTHQVELSTCPQRTSLVYGVSASVLGDSSSETVVGRLRGCRFDEDWWIHAMPMFGLLNARVSEGVIQPDGSFILSGSLRDGRHLAVIGKGRQPLKTLAFDMSEGASPRNLGNVNVRDICP